MKSISQLQMMAYASLLAALTAVGAYIAVPIGPVPIVLQSLFILLSGLLLGSTWGVAGVGIYLLAGALGLPVFAGGAGGNGARGRGRGTRVGWPSRTREAESRV